MWTYIYICRHSSIFLSVVLTLRDNEMCEPVARVEEIRGNNNNNTLGKNYPYFYKMYSHALFPLISATI